MAYATRDDLAAYVGSGVTLPDDAEVDRLLARASELIDQKALRRIDPGCSAHAAAARKAVCAQVEYWLQQDETVDVTGQVASYSIGSLSISYGSGGRESRAGGLAPRARRHLLLAGLLYRGVGVA